MNPVNGLFNLDHGGRKQITGVTHLRLSVSLTKIACFLAAARKSFYKGTEFYQEKKIVRLR
jgi:hypothetical protein